MFASIREEPRARSVGNGVGRIHRESRESTRICPAEASRLVAGGAIREDSPDSRRFVFPTKNFLAPAERNHYLHTGSPCPAVVTSGFCVFTATPQLKLGICVCVFVADQ